MSNTNDLASKKVLNYANVTELKLLGNGYKAQISVQSRGNKYKRKEITVGRYSKISNVVK
jgi:hypothetical protein